MALYVAPSSDRLMSEEANPFRRFFMLRSARRASSVLIIVGTAGCFWRPAFLYLWVSALLIGLLAMLVITLVLERLAVGGGKRLLEQYRDIPSNRALLRVLDQIPEAVVLMRPTFRFSRDYCTLDLAAVSAHGVTFIQAAPLAQANMVTGTLKTICARLSEQYSLPLVARVRFVQLMPAGIGTGNKFGPEWLVCAPLELAQFFQHLEMGAGTEEIARSFRAVFNMVLPPGIPPVPIVSSLPAPDRLLPLKAPGAITPRSPLEMAGKSILFTVLTIILGFLGIYLLQAYDYEVAEKIMVPTRAILRTVLTKEWQNRLALGEERIIREKHIVARVASRDTVRLSSQIGRRGTGVLLKTGDELHILQAERFHGQDWYLAGLVEGSLGWLPNEVIQLQHTVRQGMLLFVRPDVESIPVERADRDSPVALQAIWVRPAPDGVTVWSKVTFLDRRIRYIRGRI